MERSEPGSKQWRSVWLVVATVTLAGLSLFFSACQQGEGGQRRRTDGIPYEGGFDHYTLALSWAPAFCAQESSNHSSRECDPRRRLGFVVHGLWPERGDGRPLEYCASVPPASDSLVEDMLPLMPDRSLIQHEWRAHGSCSNAPPRDYFATVRRASSRVRIPAEFTDRRQPIRLTPMEIEAKFASASNFAGIPAVRVACRQGELTEVRVCLSKDLQPIPCSETMHDCHNGKLLVRAIR
jgi:ribonuclease T2